jgi:hypothetical protein
MGKKEDVLVEIFKRCQKTNDYVFHNDLVKTVSRKLKFQNHFDATKLDHISKVPELIRKNDYALIHLGSGHHKFIKGINKVYHSFEPIQKQIDWNYRKSLLNQYNSSESNILSVANNQRILHHFLLKEDTEFDNADISLRPKTYFPHRTKTSFEYYFGKDKLKLDNIQIEVDLTIEYKGIIGIFEAKNGTPDNFSIYQLYHPFLYYYNAKRKPELKDKIKDILCVFVVRNKLDGFDNISLWAYTFENPLDITSIKFIKSATYKLINQV